MLTQCNIQSGDNHSTLVRQNASSYAIQCSMNDEGFLCTQSSVVWILKVSYVHSPVLCEWWSFPVHTVQCCVNDEGFLCTQSSVVRMTGLSRAHSPVLCEWWCFPVYTVQCCVNDEAFLCTQSSVVWMMKLSCAHSPVLCEWRGFPVYLRATGTAPSPRVVPIMPMAVLLLPLFPQVASSHTFSDQDLTE